jgi:hypothetical protein
MSKPTKVMLLLLLLLGQPLAMADKTDVVILHNGDRVTGEIKKLEAGLLQFSTDTMGTVNIEWRFIAEIESEKYQTVETTDGQRWLGRLQKPEEGEGLILETSRGPMDIDPANIVAAWPVEATFWDKLNLDLSAGIDYAKSTKITNTNFAGDFSYQTESRLFQSALRSYITQQDQGDDQKRNSLNGTYQYFLPNLKFRTIMAGLESNEALGLDLRVYGGAGVGKYFRKTNNVWFSGTVGLSATQENPVNAPSQTNLEAVGDLRYQYFRFASPKRSLDSQLTVYPSLTDGGRWRSDFRTTFRFEMIEDLFWALETYANYDSAPLSEGAEKLDYGITSSVGWSY